MNPRGRLAHVGAEALAGVRLAGAGARAWVTSPRLMLRGAVPALITATLMAGLLLALLLNLGRLGGAVADATVGDGWARDLVAVTAAAAVLAAAVVVAVATYTAVTLAIGQPFFESIARRVDADAGGGSSDVPHESWGRAAARGLREGAVTVAISLAVSLAVLLVGLVPVIGAGSAFAVGAIVGGRLLVVELTAYPMARRGIVARRDRVRALAPVRWRAGVLGTLCFLAFLLPLGAVVVMPAAVAGATLLTRDAVASSRQG